MATASAAGTPVRSPWASTSLSRIVLSDLAGLTTQPGRAEAMQVPAVARGRALIAGLLGRHPLACYDAAAVIQPDDAPWLTATSTNQSPRTRNLWTFDDLIFGGLSLWAVSRGAGDQITDAIRVNPGLWSVDPASNRVQINGADVSAEQVILIEGPQEGLVTLAEHTIRAARAMERAWSQRVEQPVPLLELHSTDQMMDLDVHERDTLIADWEKARQNGNGTAYTPASIELRVHGTAEADLYVAGRNALRLDIANYLSLPSALLEGSMSTASLTYSTQAGQRNDLVDLSLGYWATALEARLSQDDVVAAGLNVAINLSQLAETTQPTRSPVSED